MCPPFLIPKLMGYIFISYSHKNKEYGREQVDFLADFHYTCQIQ